MMGDIKDIFDKQIEYENLNTSFIYPQLPSLYTKYYIDTWNVIPFYGKVDTLGVPVIPKQNLLRYCTYGNDAESYSTLQPVLDFFFPLRKQYESYYKAGAFTKNSKYFLDSLPPKSAYIDSNIDYFNSINSLYINFVDNIVSNNKINYINDFDIFVNELIIYVKSNNKYFTRAGYVESYDYSLLHTGLAIDIYKESPSNEEEKILFFNDTNQDAFLELCIRNNMKIDREIPWRIFLDIRTKGDGSFSDKIKNYIPNFNNNLQIFFDTYYDRVVPYDKNSYPYFQEFVNILQSFYNSFLNITDSYKTYGVNACGNAKVITNKKNLLVENEINYDREKYLKLYLYFRNAELSKTVPLDKLDMFSELAINLYKIHNTSNSTADSIIESVRFYTNNIGTLAYRHPSLYELDSKSKMP